MAGPVIADERWSRLIAEHQAASRARRVADAPAPLSEAARVLSLWIGCGAGAVALALLGMSAWHLREAHVGHAMLQGVPAARAFLPAAAGALLAVAAALCLLNAGRGGSRRGVLVLQALSGLLLVSVVGLWAYAQWVADRIGCLSTCG